MGDLPIIYVGCLPAIYVGCLPASGAFRVGCLVKVPSTDRVMLANYPPLPLDWDGEARVDPEITGTSLLNFVSPSRINLTTYDNAKNAANCSIIATDTGHFGSTF